MTNHASAREHFELYRSVSRLVNPHNAPELLDTFVDFKTSPRGNFFDAESAVSADEVEIITIGMDTPAIAVISIYLFTHSQPYVRNVPNHEGDRPNNDYTVWVPFENVPLLLPEAETRYQTQDYQRGMQIVEEYENLKLGIGEKLSSLHTRHLTRLLLDVDLGQVRPVY